MRTAVLGPTQELSLVRRASIVAGLTCLTIVGAKCAAPTPWLPITLQTAAVLFAGLWGGSRLGAAAQVSYLTLGLAGLPVFALPGAGPSYFVGPTAGYLLAFPLAAWIAGMGQGKRSWVRIGACLAAAWTVVGCGGAWLVLCGGGSLWWTGIAPFLIPEAAKATLVALLVGTLPARWRQAY